MPSLSAYSVEIVSNWASLVRPLAFNCNLNLGLMDRAPLTYVEYPLFKEEHVVPRTNEPSKPGDKAYFVGVIHLDDLD